MEDEEYTLDWVFQDFITAALDDNSLMYVAPRTMEDFYRKARGQIRSHTKEMMAEEIRHEVVLMPDRVTLAHAFMTKEDAKRLINENDLNTRVDQYMRNGIPGYRYNRDHDRLWIKMYFRPDVYINAGNSQEFRRNRMDRNPDFVRLNGLLRQHLNSMQGDVTA